MGDAELQAMSSSPEFYMPANFDELSSVLAEVTAGVCQEPPAKTTTTTTTTSTTTTTLPPPLIEETDFLNIEITNELITSIPLFEDVDLTDQEKNSIAVIISTGIIFLFYIVLLLQEWFNKIISTNNIRWFAKDKNIRGSKSLLL